MSQEQVLVCDEVPEFFLSALREMNFAVDYQPGISYESVLKEIGRFNGVMIRSSLLIDAAVIENAEKLKFILRPGSGLDNIDVEAATHSGITIINSPEGNRNAVAEHTAGLLLSLLNNISQASREVRQMKWQREENRGWELAGKVVGLVGYGNTGSSFGQKLMGFDVEVIAYDKYKSGFSDSVAHQVDLEDIFERADVLSLHIPLNRETYHFINAEFIAKFKKPFYLLNTSRGKNVNTKDLLDAVEQGKVLGAALDVLENEDLESYSQEEKALLQRVINNGKILITPHIAGWTFESKQKIFSTLIDKLKIHLANPEEVKEIMMNPGEDDA
ncbi:MAG: NAD(P)-dependent oxidoreductase [Bacteroidia bacterium]